MWSPAARSRPVDPEEGGVPPQHWRGDFAPLSLTRHSLVGNPYWIKWYWERSFKKSRHKWDTTQRTSCILQKTVKTTRLCSVTLNILKLRPDRKIIPTAGSRDAPSLLLLLATLEHSSCFCLVFCFFASDFCNQNSWRASVQTAKCSKQLPLPVARFRFVVEIFKYETHLKSSCSYRGSIPTLEWSHY